MRLMLALGLSTALLAACNNPVANNSSGNAAAGNLSTPAPGGNVTAPGGNMMVPGGEADGGPGGMGQNGMAPGGAGRGESREGMLAECVGGAPGNVPPGTDVNALCGCAVDRVMAGSGQRDAIRQCADEQGVQLSPGSTRD